MAKLWTPGPLFRLFFRASWSLEVSPEGLRINRQLFSWIDITTCEVHPILFWAYLRVGSLEDVIVLRGMSRRLANEISGCARAVGSLMPAVKSIRAAMAGSRYVSNKLIREALATCESSAAGWDIDKAKLIAPDLTPLRPDLQFYKQIAAGDFSDIDARNDYFVANEMVLHDEYFRAVESSVLTVEQRVASIVMEDCNLVPHPLLRQLQR